jgi:hypothetical protein
MPFAREQMRQAFFIVSCMYVCVCPVENFLAKNKVPSASSDSDNSDNDDEDDDTEQDIEGSADQPLDF